MKDLDKDFGFEGNDLSDNHENKCSDYKVIDNVENIKDSEEGVQENKEILEEESKILFAQQKDMAAQKEGSSQEAQAPRLQPHFQPQRNRRDHSFREFQYQT